MKSILRVCVSAGVLFGQTVTGTLEGRVTDPSGAVIVGAKITARNDETGLARSTATNQEGYWQLTFLPVGPHTVTAESKGFATTHRAAPAELNSVRSVEFQLTPAQVATEITVSDEAPVLDITRGETKSNIEAKVIEDRPLSSRNILSLMEMLPGFQTSGGYSGVNNPTLSSGSYVSFNGTGSRSAAFQIDGVNNDDSLEGSNRQNVNISSIKEFQVLTNAYSAEFGRAGGAVVLVQTKSGTNAFHGDAYEFLQNQKLNANSFYGNASGRDKNGNQISPRPPYRRNQFGYTGGGPIFKNKLFFFNRFEQTRLIQYNTYTRWIFLPSDKIQIGDCRLCLKPEEHPNIQADKQFLESILAKFPRVAPNNPNLCDHCYTETKRASYPDQDYSGKLDYNPGTRDTFALRYQYSRQKRTPYPLIWGETAFQNNRYNLSHVRGRHVLRGGIDMRRQHLDDLADNYSRGWWSFNAAGVLGQPSRYEGWENFLRGYVASFEKGYGNFTTYNRLGEFNQYFLDDIKLLPTFTLNLGFRWEVVLKPTERDGKIVYDYSTFTKGYQPRFGFAWSPKASGGLWAKITGGPGRFSIRGGIGLLQNEITNRARFLFLSPVNGVLYDKIDPDLGNTSPAPGYISIAQPRTNERRPDTRYSSIIFIRNGSWSYINALRAELKKRFSRGLHWQVAYTFGKTMDTGSDVTAGNPISEKGSSRSLRGLSDFHQRHRVNLNWGWTLPWFAKSRGFTRAALGGWTLTNNMTFASGNPFTVGTGYDLNADGTANDRPILLDQPLYGRSVDNPRPDPRSGKQISVGQLPLAGFYPTVALDQQPVVRPDLEHLQPVQLRRRLAQRLGVADHPVRAEVHILNLWALPIRYSFRRVRWVGSTCCNRRVS